MDHRPTFSSMIGTAIVAASMTMVLSTGAVGACKATLRGELVQAPAGVQAFPMRYLSFTLFEVTRNSGTSPGKRVKIFESFVIPNTRTTFPIPFALDIDSPNDCPGERELGVGTRDTEHPRLTHRYKMGHNSSPLAGAKTILLDQFESIPVWGPRF